MVVLPDQHQRALTASRCDGVGAACAVLLISDAAFNSRTGGRVA